MFQYILFDLDGTLTDPEEGITKSVQYALKALGIEEPDRHRLQHFIGPPLKEHFMETYHLTGEQGEYALLKYRERFRAKGMYENVVYPGIPELLNRLRDDGRKLAVASSKPQEFVEEILRHFDLEQYFQVIVGSEMDGRRTAKAEVVAEVVKQLEISEADKRNTVLVGDRRHDVEGAGQNQITALGVTYGYGGRSELETAGADVIVDTTEDVLKRLW